MTAHEAREETRRLLTLFLVSGPHDDQRVEQQVKDQLRSKERSWEGGTREIFVCLSLLLAIARLGQEDVKGFESLLDRALISNIPETSRVVLQLLQSPEMVSLCHQVSCNEAGIEVIQHSLSSVS